MSQAVAPRPRFTSPKYDIFVREYLKDFNATQAVIRAGYSKTGASVTGVRLLANPMIAARLAELVKDRAGKLGAEADDVLRELLLIARSDIAQAYDADGRLLPPQELPEAFRRSVSGIEVTEEFEGRGEDRVSVGVTKKLKLWDKPRALELLGKHLGLFLDREPTPSQIVVVVQETIVECPHGH